jgi:hypothetical protein
MIVSTIDANTCGNCGRRFTDASRVLSRHSTSEGVVAWVRCPCGALQARFRPYGPGTERVVASSESPSEPHRRNGHP